MNNPFPELVKFEIPKDTKDLKNFFEYCKVITNYKTYQDHFNSQLHARKTEIEEYTKKIITENFHKSLKDWMDILSPKDQELLKKQVLSEVWVPDKKKQDKVFLELIEDNNHHYLRCHVTNKFYDLSRRCQINFKYIKYEIYGQTVIIRDSFTCMVREATCYSNGYIKTMYHTYTINLIDFSVKLEKETFKTSTFWKGFGR